MKTSVRILLASSIFAAGTTGQAIAGECKQVHAQIVSSPTTDGCASPIGLCTSGTIDGNQALHGTTFFTADSAAPGPATAPNSAATISYSGVLQVTTARGSLTTRGTGIFDTSNGAAPGGFFSSFEVVTGGSGKYAGTTGSLFIGGKTISGQFVTSVITGKICFP